MRSACVCPRRCSREFFGAGKQLTGVYAPTPSPALSPAEAQEEFVVPPGFEVRLFAAEPDVVNPVAMTWDERGRLWVVELYEYPLGAPRREQNRATASKFSKTRTTMGARTRSRCLRTA